MNLDEAQRQRVAQWVGQGIKLSEIQTRLNSEFGLRLTYMEVRFLVDDLKVIPKDPDPPKPPPAPTPAPETRTGSDAAPPGSIPPPASPLSGQGSVSVTVDQLARPGALVSGKVTFSDGNTAEWYMDQTGRLGLVAKQPGYRPPASDVPQFQAALEAELAKLGL